MLGEWTNGELVRVAGGDPGRGDGPGGGGEARCRPGEGHALKSSPRDAGPRGPRRHVTG